MGTPTEDVWPGVTTYPDFKASFPRWIQDTDTALCPSLEPAGQELLELMLIYDPASRISAKQACNHPYFDDLASKTQSRTTYGSGYH